MGEPSEIVLAQESALIAGTEPLTSGEAEWLTARIKAYVGQSWRLLVIAYKRNAHKALGYKSWEGYVGDEFGISRSRAYQLLDRAYVIGEIEAAVAEVVEVPGDVSTDVDTSALDSVISEAAARDLKSQLPDVTEKIKAGLTENPDADPAEVVAAVIAEARSGGADAPGGPSGPGAPSGAPAEDAGGPSQVTEGGDTASSTATTDPPADPSHEERAAQLERRDEERNPDLALVEKFMKAAAKCSPLYAYDPGLVAEAADPESRRQMEGVARDLHGFATRIESALRRTAHLRSVGQ